MLLIIKIVSKYQIAVTFLAMLLGWFLIAKLGLIGPTLIASPEEVFNAILDGFDADAPKSQRIHIHAIHTIQRALQGWGYSIFFGLSLGFFVGFSRKLYNIAEPIIEFSRSIPPILIFPLLLVANNYGHSAYTWTIAFGCIPVMTLTVAQGLSNLNRTRVDLLSVYDVSSLRRVALTSLEMAPSIILGARLCLSLAIIIAVVSEMVFTPRSGFAIGALARDAEIEFNTPVFYSSLLSIGVFGYTTNTLFRKLEEWFKGKPNS